MLCLDSNIAIALLRGGFPHVEERLAAAMKERVPLALSTIVLTELQFGVYRAKNGDKARAAVDRLLRADFSILPFEQDDATCAARLRAELAENGLSIGPFDVLIAGQAVSRGLTLVTNNRREFSRVPGLAIVDWLTP